MEVKSNWRIMFNLNKEEVNQGMFAVRLCAENNHIVARLTGEHFSAEECATAKNKFYCDEKLRHSFLDLESPTYLVRDSVVRLAFDNSRDPKLFKCHDGVNGTPCGECEECEKEKREAFTWVILGDVYLPDSNISKNLVHSISSMFGTAKLCTGFEVKMSKREVKDVFEYMGVCPKNASV